MEVISQHDLYKPGGDLLSRALRQSTIGAERLNDRVRNGIGWGPLAITTRLMQIMLCIVKISYCLVVLRACYQVSRIDLQRVIRCAQTPCIEINKI